MINQTWGSSSQQPSSPQPPLTRLWLPLFIIGCPLLLLQFHCQYPPCLYTDTVSVVTGQTLWIESWNRISGQILELVGFLRQTTSALRELGALTSLRSGVRPKAAGEGGSWPGKGWREVREHWAPFILIRPCSLIHKRGCGQEL